MTGFAGRLRRVPLLAWVTGVLALGWVVGGGLLWAQHSGSEAAADAAPTPVSTPSTSPSPSQPATVVPSSACKATVAVTNAWDGGFQVDVTVATTGGDIEDWTVTLSLGSASVDGAWNSTLAKGATGDVNAANVDYNGTISAGGTTGFGLTAVGKAPASIEATCTSTTAPSSANLAPTDEAGAPPPVFTSASNVKSPTDDDWLSTDGNRIVDDKGNPVWLTGANWFGFNTSERVFHGLSNARMGDILDAVASRGINVIRVPISTELLLEWKGGKAVVPSAVNQSNVSDVAGKTSLEIFDMFLAGSKDRGLKVILDVHSAKADNSGHLAPMWFSGDITEQDFYDAWAWAAQRYSKDDTIIGFDLKNEPHGQPAETPHAIWDGSTSANNWRHVAEEVSKRIQAVNPHALILVEGIEATPKAGKNAASTSNADFDFDWWGGNLRGAAAYPVRLDVDNKLVYSPHDYGPLVYEQPWFKSAFTADSLRKDVWGPNWLYLHDAGTAPLLIGEWGGRIGQDPRQDKWLTAVRDLIVSEHLAHTFWCINPNSGDTGGLLLDDWKSWDEAKYALLRPALWHDRDGKFVSLDHATALPGGISVTTYYADKNPAPL